MNTESLKRLEKFVELGKMEFELAHINRLNKFINNGALDKIIDPRLNLSIVTSVQAINQLTSDEYHSKQKKAAIKIYERQSGKLNNDKTPYYDYLIWNKKDLKEDVDYFMPLTYKDVIQIIKKDLHVEK